MPDGHGNPKRYEEYTVAVICAIDFEMSAVRYMLDREHGRVRPRGDLNMYVLGELSGHDVVLACLPGNQGKGAAAIVATNVARTFPSIKWRFLVGIGGGVPSDKHDIRLGDVVVSMPKGEHGGVLQCDLGRDIEDDFQQKGFLCPPPTILRSAVGMMKSDHLTADNKVQEFLSQMVQKFHRLSIYARPPAGLDILFKPGYPHAPGQPTCAKCDPAHAVARRPRASDQPEIHYGLIASGDRVVKSAAKRDQAVQVLGEILCFEMEAAGIATEFSCIIIRGISDYADSHKNDCWHHYAAAAAAAAVKELLSYLDPEKPSPGAVPPFPSGPVSPASSGSPPVARPASTTVGIQQDGSGNTVSVGGNFNMTVISRDQRLDEATPRKPFSTVPFLKDDDFIERPAISAWLRKQYRQPGSRFALAGLGGTGKSQLAIQFAHRVRQQSPNRYVFWVHASTRERFEEAYRDIADRLKLPRRHDPETDVLRLVHDWLIDEENGQWLMILDNADDIDVFYPRNSKRGTADSSTRQPLAALLPQGSNGSILVTSRSRDAAERLTGSGHNVSPVLAMDELQAKQLLQNKLLDKYDEEVAADLVLALECMPLAITQAAAYIIRRAPRMSASAYLREFRKSRTRKADLLREDRGDLRRDTGAANSVVTTWQITFSQIRQEPQSAADLLSFMSFFNPQGIPDWVLQSYVRRRHEGEAGVNGIGGGGRDSGYDGDAELEDDLEILRGYSLVSQAGVCEMHALVQFCTRVWLSDDGERWKSTYLRNISLEYPAGDYENWRKCQQLEPHIATVVDTEPIGEDAWDWARLLTKVAWYRRKIGQYVAAEKMAREAVNVMDRTRCAEHPDTLASVSNLAMVVESQGKYEEAEQMNRQALDGYEKQLGAEDPYTLTSVSNLAEVLGRQGKYKEAEQMNRRALNGHEKQLGAEHPYTLTSVSSLALVLESQGRYEEAEQMNRRALDGREKQLGMEHPSTLTSVKNLAHLFEQNMQLTEADELYQRAYNGFVKVLGPGHPTTVACGRYHSSLKEQKGG